MPVLTTHVGSLPRTQDVVDMLFARERSPIKHYSTACMTAAVDENVRRHGLAGVIDGDSRSKISYSIRTEGRHNAPADVG